MNVMAPAAHQAAERHALRAEMSPELLPHHGRLKSALVLLGAEYWNWTEPDYGHLADRRSPVYSVLKNLASEKGFADYVHITDSTLKRLISSSTTR